MEIRVVNLEEKARLVKLPAASRGASIAQPLAAQAHAKIRKGLSGFLIRRPRVRIAPGAPIINGLSFRSRSHYLSVPPCMLPAIT